MDTGTAPDLPGSDWPAEGPRLPKAEASYLRAEVVLANLADGLLVVDDRGRVRQVNPACERLFGRPASELLGQPFPEALSLRCVRPGCALGELLSATSLSCEAPAIATSASGEEIPLLVSCASLPLEGGRVGTVVLVHDIRPLKEAERLREDLIHMLIHDLKGPLASISSTIQLLRQYPPGQLDADASRTLLDIAEKNAWRLARLVDTILDVQRLEAGRSVLRIEPVPVAETVDEVMGMARPLAMESGVEMEASLPPDLPPVLADAEMLRRILWNLLDNALKYTPAGGEIEVRARWLRPSAPPGQAWVQFQVSDTGPGIPPEDQARIFDKYAQAQMGTARRRGVGLGLTFCRLAVEAMGGRIWVESARGAGSTFSFVLPVAGP